MHEGFYLGIDLGGTNIKTGIVDSQGNVLHKISVPTGQGPHAAISNILASANKVACLAGERVDLHKNLDFAVWQKSRQKPRRV